MYVLYSIVQYIVTGYGVLRIVVRTEYSVLFVSHTLVTLVLPYGTP